MTNGLPRLLLALGALILLVGGLMHAAAFGKAVSAADASNLPAFYANSLKGLWLIDVATLITLAALFGLLAVRPGLASGGVVILVALIPAATAFFLYRFMGNFLPAHMLMAAALISALAGVLMRPAP